MLILGLAELALSRPGWDWACGELAEKFGGRQMFESFKETSRDRVNSLYLAPPDAPASTDTDTASGHPGDPGAPRSD